MTSRDLLLRVLRHEAVDRVPVSPFIHVNFVKAFSGNDDVDVIQRTVDVYDHFGFDIIHRNCTPAYDDLGLDSDQWHVDSEIVRDGRDETVTTLIRTPRGNLTQVHRTVWVSRFDTVSTPVDYLIKSEQDLDLIMRYQPPVGRLDTSCITRAREVLGDGGVTAPWVQGAFNFVAHSYRPLDQLVMDALMNPEMYHRMMAYFLERNKAIIAQFIDAGVDVLSYAGNIASGSMIGDSFFREYVFDYEKQLIDFVKSRGAFVLYHNCGYAKCLFSAYRELAMSAYESLTPAPYGDTVLEEAFAEIGPDVVLHGHIDQIDFLRKAQPNEVRRNVQSVLEKAKHRGNFILGTTDYLNEDTPHGNIYALAEAARDYGSY